MSILRDFLPLIPLFWLLTFVATLLLSLPGFFRRTTVRRPRHLPSSHPSATRLRHAMPPMRLWQRILCIAFIPLMLLIGFLVVIPAVFAMVFLALVHAYRCGRRLAYRALRRRHRRLAFPLSFPTGLAVFVRRLHRPHRPPVAGHA